MNRLLRASFRPAWQVPDDVTDCELAVLSRWYGNTAEDVHAAYGKYVDQTAFISIERHDTGEVIGFSRLIAPGPRVAKTLSDITGEPWHVDAERVAAAARIDPEVTWDIATLGVRPNLRGEASIAAYAVYHAILAALRANAARTLVAVVDHRVRRLLAAVGLTCHVLPGTWPALYMGSRASVPVYSHLAALVDRQRAEFPDAYRGITLGAGLAEVDLPSSDAFRWPGAAERTIVLPPDRVEAVHRSTV